LLTRSTSRALFLVLLVVCAFAQCTFACALTTCDATASRLPPCHRQKHHESGQSQTCERLALLAESPAPILGGHPQASQSQPVYLPAAGFARLSSERAQLLTEQILTAPPPLASPALASVLRI